MYLIVVDGIPVISNTLNFGVETFSSYPVMTPFGKTGIFHVTVRDVFEF